MDEIIKSNYMRNDVGLRYKLRFIPFEERKSTAQQQLCYFRERFCLKYLIKNTTRTLTVHEAMLTI